VREQLVLVLRLEAGKEFTDALRADLVARNRRLLDFKRVGGYVIWERDFPRTASLKIKRNLLAEEIRDRLDRAAAVVPL
jgi:long-chain acyl-CoA synthetase